MADGCRSPSCLDVETLYKKIVQLHELDALDELPSPALAADVFRSFLKTLWTSPHVSAQCDLTAAAPLD